MTVLALQHLFSSVERGYFPQHGQGFQTVAVAEELAGTEDLTVLEDASFYAVSRERRASGDLPVKETFFRLPSGRFALGRTVPWGADALGREGNYLTHHLIVTGDDLRAVAGDPFALFDAAPRSSDADLHARGLPPVPLEAAPCEPEFSILAGLAAPWRAGLGAALIARGDISLLIAGDEALSRALLRESVALLPLEERLRFTFSTHFYESEHLREHFAVVTVGSLGEAPSRIGEYAVFPLDGEPPPPSSIKGAYAVWLASRLGSGEWREIQAMSTALNCLRSGELQPGEPVLPAGPLAGAALWEQVGAALAPALVGQAERIPEYLAPHRDRRRLADALLAAASPSQLCGATPDPATPEALARQAACLQAVRAAASPLKWRAWVKHWATDPALLPITRSARPWWRRWGR
jgi:hypothetical protein